MAESLLIALDWDGTFSADRELWLEFIRLAGSRGHRVFIATARRTDQCDEIMRVVGPLGVPIVATGGKPKINAVDDLAGYLPDIWIDDEPDLLFRESKQ